MLTVNTNNSHIPLIPTLLSMDKEDKLRVIHILTESMISPSSEPDKDKTTRMLCKHAGSWAGPESVSEIMETIRSTSSIRKPLTM